MRKHGADPSVRLTAAILSSSPDLLKYLERRVSTDAAGDALAEVMMTAWRKVGSLPADATSARMWLFVIARNTASNVARGERRHLHLTEQFRSALEAAPPEGHPSDAGIEVRDAISRLTPDQAELVRLIHWDGFSIAEAGEILGISPSTARTRYQRARTDLKAALSLPAYLPNRR